VFEIGEPHLPFVGFWAIAAFLAVTWNAPVARHLVGLAAVEWFISAGIGIDRSRYADPVFTTTAGFSLLVGAGLALASRGSDSLRAFGLTLSHYGAFALALILAAVIVISNGYPRSALPNLVVACAALATILPFMAAIMAGRVGPALAGISIALALVVVSGWIRPPGDDDPWLLYALALASMLCLVVSGMLDEARPRVVAGWIGLACVIAAITWAVKGSLLRRAVFLAAAGIVAVALASLLGRLVLKERAR
jgi:hypothetical protein